MTGEDVDAAALGGHRVHERNGVCHLVAPTDVDAALLARDLLDYLPQNAEERPIRWPTVDPPGYAPDRVVPAEDRKVYDVRDVARALLDGGRMLEISPRWARNVVCAFGRLDGRSIGIVANQPRYLGGVLDVDASQKAARFVRTCNLFGIPLLVLVDTPGFLPGTKQEKLGVIRQGAKLVYAFSECTVPRVTVDPAQGVRRRLHRDEQQGARRGLRVRLAVGAARRDGRAAGGRDHQPPRDRGRRGSGAARATRSPRATPPSICTRARRRSDGYVDEVIAPSDTRARVGAAFAALESAPLRRWPAGNIPL